MNSAKEVSLIKKIKRQEQNRINAARFRESQRKKKEAITKELEEIPVKIQSLKRSIEEKRILDKMELDSLLKQKMELLKTTEKMFFLYGNETF